MAVWVSKKVQILNMTSSHVNVLSLKVMVGGAVHAVTSSTSSRCSAPNRLRLFNPSLSLSTTAKNKVMEDLQHLFPDMEEPECHEELKPTLDHPVDKHAADADRKRRGFLLSEVLCHRPHLHHVQLQVIPESPHKVCQSDTEPLTGITNVSPVHGESISGDEYNF